VFWVVVQGDHSGAGIAYFDGFAQGGSENVRLAALNLEGFKKGWIWVVSSQNR